MESPIVVSVPKCTTCLSLSDVIVNLVDVGAFTIIVALTSKGLDTAGFQTNVLPSLIVAINCAPKLSKDQLPGSRITEDVVEPEPQVNLLHVLVPQPYPYV